VRTRALEEFLHIRHDPEWEWHSTSASDARVVSAVRFLRRAIVEDAEKARRQSAAQLEPSERDLFLEAIKGSGKNLECMHPDASTSDACASDAGHSERLLHVRCIFLRSLKVCLCYRRHTMGLARSHAPRLSPSGIIEGKPVALARRLFVLKCPWICCLVHRENTCR
jgi:hypothetical protein